MFFLEAVVPEVPSSVEVEQKVVGDMSLASEYFDFQLPGNCKAVARAGYKVQVGGTGSKTQQVVLVDKVADVHWHSSSAQGMDSV